MQQVRTHFSAAYELPLLTRAENYAQVSASPGLQEWASQMGLIKRRRGPGHPRMWEAWAVPAYLAC